jgi:ABC-type nitrate/sulfonate/bicarbonate transport system substrate-binding protein
MAMTLWNGRARFLVVVLVPALLALSAVSAGAAARRQLTVFSTVTRVTNLPTLVGLKLLRQDGIDVVVKDLKTPEAVVLALTESQGDLALAYAAFYPAVEKGAPIRAFFELARPEFVVVAKKEIATPQALNGVKLASHSPRATVQSLLEHYFRDHPGVKPNYVFMPAGSPARAEAILQGAVDAVAVDVAAAQAVLDRAPDKFHVLIDLTTAPVSNSFLAARIDFANQNADLMKQAIRRLLESHRKGVKDPTYWAREGQEFFKEIEPAALERQVRPLVRLYDPDGGIDRLKGAGAEQNIAFQVDVKNLTGPASKWTPAQFFQVAPLEQVLAEMGRAAR